MKARWWYLLTLILGLTGIALPSCNEKEEEITSPQPGGGRSFLSLQVADLKPYAADPESATPAEIALSTIDIYIYSSNNSLELFVSLTSDDFEDLGDQVWRLKDSRLIETTSGEKQIYAGINLPDAYRTVFAESDTNPVQVLRSGIQLENEETGHAMFSRTVVSCSLQDGETASVTIPVERLLAKIAVFDGVADFRLEGEGAFSTLQYDVYNRNTRFFLLRNTDDYLDPNYTQSGWQQGEYKDHLNAGTGFIPVEKDPGIYNKYLNVKYTLENSTEVFDDNSYSKLLQTATYVVISSVFHPEKVTVYGNAGWQQQLLNTNQPGTTFYRITYSTGDTEYVVAGSLYEVQTYALEVTGEDLSLITKIETYTNGRCYYAAFLDEKRNHDVRRNHFYILYVNGFAGLGSPHYPGEPGDNGKPGEPGPVPEPDTASLLITVKLVDWYDDPEEWVW